MNIEIHKPELEAMLQSRMATGRFHDVEEILIEALRSTEPVSTDVTQPSLLDILTEARFLLDGEELDLTRDPSPGRSVDLS